MRIATWNIERLKHISEKNTIEKLCSDLEADILVLTEADKRIELEYEFVYETDALSVAYETAPGKRIDYKESERRIVIYSKHPCVRVFDTKDSKTSVAIELDTPAGNIIVYGVIIGVLGNRDANFNTDLENAISDIKRLSVQGPMIICGDFNCSFSDGYYFTKHGRDAMRDLFDKCNMTIATAGCKECIDHIVVSDSVIRDKSIAINEWNEDKRLSDHKGIMISIEGCGDK